jgi:uncharacterized membrane protein YbhN (UPF0104 family)
VSRRRVFGWILGGGIILVLLVTLDGRTIGQILRGANPALVVIGVAGLTAVHLVGAATWRELTRRMTGITLGWRPAVWLYYAGQALGGFTPANLGSDAYRATALRALGDKAAVVVPIAVQRATSWIALSALGLAALPLVTVPADVSAGPVIVATAVAGLALAAAGLGWWRRHPRLLPAIGGSDLRRAAVVGLAGGIAFHLVAVACGYLLVLAVEPGAATLAPAVIGSLAIARLSLLVPLTPSGLGIGEATLAILFAGIGIGPETALAASLLARLGLVATTVIGGIALASGSGDRVALAHPEPRSPSS